MRTYRRIRVSNMSDRHSENALGLVLPCPCCWQPCKSGDTRRVCRHTRARTCTCTCTNKYYALRISLSVCTTLLYRAYARATLAYAFRDINRCPLSSQCACMYMSVAFCLAHHQITFVSNICDTEFSLWFAVYRAIHHHFHHHTK